MLLAKLSPPHHVNDPIAQPSPSIDVEDPNQVGPNIDTQLRSKPRRKSFVPDERSSLSVGRTDTMMHSARKSAAQSLSERLSVMAILHDRLSDTAPKQNTRLRAYHFIGKTSEIVYSSSGDHRGSSAAAGRITGPGMAFIEEVQNRIGLFGTILSEMQTDNYREGIVDQQLVEDFADTHPYFASGKLEAENRELYREKMAFYFARRALSRNLGGVDIMATAVGLVAGCVIRDFRCSIVPLEQEDIEVVTIGENNALSEFILSVIRADFPAISVVSVPHEGSP